MAVAVGFEAVDGADMGMIEGGEQLGFAPEPGIMARIVDGVWGAGAENLDGNIAVEAGVEGAIDLAHSSRAYALLHPVDAEHATGERGFISVAFDLRHPITVSSGAVELRICWIAVGLRWVC